MMYWPVAKEMLYNLKDISIFSSGSHVVQPNFQINLSRGQHEDHFCEIIFILDQWSRIFHLKIFLI